MKVIQGEENCQMGYCNQSDIILREEKKTKRDTPLITDLNDEPQPLEKIRPIRHNHHTF